MYVMKNHGFKRKYVYGGSGVFDSLAKLFTSGVAKQLTSTAIDVGKEVGKKTAIDVGTKLVKKSYHPKSSRCCSAARRSLRSTCASRSHKSSEYFEQVCTASSANTRKTKYQFTYRWVWKQCYCHTGPSPKITWVRSENYLK